MSAATLELARMALDARDAGDLDALLALCHPEFELHTSGVYPGLEPVYHGLAVRLAQGLCLVQRLRRAKAKTWCRKPTARSLEGS